MKTIIYGICFITALSLSGQNTGKEKSVDMNTLPNQSIQAKDSNIWNVFQNRRSVRKFKPDSVPQADILKIINAARMAPTSGNQQPWKFLIIRDKNKINQLKEACISNVLDRLSTEEKQAKAEAVKSRFGDYFSAPVYIVVLTDNHSMYPDYNHWDGPLAAGYLMLAARALGYGTVFITDAIPDDITKRVLNISDDYTRVCITPLGIPFEWPDSPPKKNLEDFILYEHL
jgi:nitroreductase